MYITNSAVDNVIRVFSNDDDSVSIGRGNLVFGRILFFADLYLKSSKHDSMTSTTDSSPKKLSEKFKR